MSFYWYRVKWYCHFDDDIYVNVKELSKLLAKYNSSKPYYIGRNPRGPGGVMVRNITIYKVKSKLSGTLIWKNDLTKYLSIN